jgi:hypothetical protein
MIGGREAADLSSVRRAEDAGEAEERIRLHGPETALSRIFKFFRGST